MDGREPQNEAINHEVENILSRLHEKYNNFHRSIAENREYSSMFFDDFPLDGLSEEKRAQFEANIADTDLFSERLRLAMADETVRITSTDAKRYLKLQRKRELSLDVIEFLKEYEIKVEQAWEIMKSKYGYTETRLKG